MANLLQVIRTTNNQLAHFLDNTNPSLATWSGLIDGLEPAMDAIYKISIVKGLLPRSGHQREASGGLGSTVASMLVEKTRYLGDHISKEKMLAVGVSCRKVLSELGCERGCQEMYASADVYCCCCPPQRN